MSNAHVQPLESRAMMSATAAVSAAVAADHLEIRADLLRFRADVEASAGTLLRDAAAFKGEHLAAATTVTPKVAQFRTDLAAMRLTLKADRLAQSQAVLADESVIVGDLRRRLLDHGDATAVAADNAKLTADRAKLQSDDVAGLDARIATRTAADTTLFNDVTAIESAADTDPNASAALKASVQQFGTDWEARLTTLTADLSKLSADRATLVADLSAD